MTRPDRIKSPFDRALYQIITGRWSEERATKYVAHLNRHEAAVAKAAVNSLQSVDAKAAGLLQHVSMMMAGLGLLAPIIAQSDIEVAIVLIEIALYLLIAIGCLRCLAIFQSKDLFASITDAKEAIRRELIIRRELYALCNKAAIVLTIAAFLTLPFLFFYAPERAQ